MPCRLSGCKPASQSQASWVSTLCVVGLPVVDRLKNALQFLGKLSGWLCLGEHGFHKSRHILGQNVLGEPIV